jgi:hypothetical protein
MATLQMSGGQRNNPGTIGMGSPSTISASYQAQHSFMPLNSLSTLGYGSSSGQPYSKSPTMHRSSAEASPPKYSPNDARSGTSTDDNSPTGPQQATLLLRRLPSTMSKEALVSMLLFAEDFLDAGFTKEAIDEPGFQSAFASFKTYEGANEARNKLHGKPNATNDASMIVEMLANGASSSSSHLSTSRKYSDTQSLRQIPSASSTASAQSGNNRLSRYNTTFQSMDKISPNKLSTDYPAQEAPSHAQGFFGGHSPNAHFAGRVWGSGKGIHNDESGDGEAATLSSYPSNGQSGAQRYGVQSDIPISRMANLKLNTTDDYDNDRGQLLSASGPYNARPGRDLQSPTGGDYAGNPMSPSSYSQLSPQLQRQHYPAANPADQNPPCNTLYVGNLPIDTSEDELKTIFSKQRGYKRLCFRTKHNGPMCFVEFEDVTFATKALNELYGQPLHNSVKGGIRLSFSKNPLGVRTGQGNNYGLQSPLTSPNGQGFGSIGAPPGFASGPPPGLTMPPGLSSNVSNGINGFAGAGASSSFFSAMSPSGPTGHSSQPFRNQQGLGNGQMMMNGYRHGTSPGGAGMPDYLLGR